MIEFLKVEESDISHNTLISERRKTCLKSKVLKNLGKNGRASEAQNLPKITDFEEFRQKKQESQTRKTCLKSEILKNLGKNGRDSEAQNLPKITDFEEFRQKSKRVRLARLA